ncbi:hypothetical protein BSZ31_10755 [Limnobacter sp. SAORIC-690]|jgi:hypothetical protein|nr:hypothetical protein BSZ31_10755 [Limnobacter sp. SAORIC-690]
MDRTVIRSGVQQGRIFVWGALGFACFWIALAVNALSSGVPVGRTLFTRLVLVPVFEAGGATAVAAIFIGFALCCVVVARFVWRRAPRVPADRWWRW